MFTIAVDCWDVYESSLDFHGLSVRKNDLWSVVTADDMGMCAKTCKLTKDCLSFTYNWITRDCRVSIDRLSFPLLITKVLLHFPYELIMRYHRNN